MNSRQRNIRLAVVDGYIKNQLIKFFSKVAGFIVSLGLNTLATVFDPETYKKIFEFVKFTMNLAMLGIPSVIAKVIKFWKSGKLQKSLTQFMEGVGGLINGLVNLLTGLGLAKFLLGATGDPAEELEKPREEEEKLVQRLMLPLKRTGDSGNMTQEQAQAQIRYMELEEAMSDALENNDMKLYEQLEKNSQRYHNLLRVVGSKVLCLDILFH